MRGAGVEARAGCALPAPQALQANAAMQHADLAMADAKSDSMG